VRSACSRFGAAIQECSAEAGALILVIGVVAGVFPIYGCPTILCLLASMVLRLNFPAPQLVNQLSLPLQIAMAIPFARLGARIAGSPGGIVAALPWG
jgi:uncharacterized protein (DUF2062 family)